MYPLKYTGVWWLPNKEDNSVAGTLTISFEDRFHLDLIGQFDQGGNYDLFDSKAYPIILGITGESKQVTVCNCVLTSFNLAFSRAGNLGKQEFYVGGAVYIGMHFYSEQPEIRFNKIQVGYSHLQEWTDLFKPNVQFKQGEFSLIYNFPGKRIAPLTGGSLSLAPDIEATHNIRQVGLKQTMQIVFEMQEALNLEEWLVGYIVPFKIF